MIMAIITVASFKGGVGKTTTAIHIAAYLNLRKPALLIDGDANRSALEWNARGEGLPFKVIDEKQTARYARDFDQIVIDSEARPNDRDLKTLAESCDLLILPTTPDAMSLSALMRTVDALRAMRANHFKILLTIIPPKPSRDGDEARALIEENKLPLFKGAIRRFVAFQKAALLGVTVEDVPGDPNAIEGWEDYLEISRQIKI
jgi:chromosome partitioning protein